jgi:hypothetical protein
MSEFIEELLAGDGLVQREVTYDGKTGMVTFRRISAGERGQLLKGQKIAAHGGQSTYELDLSENQQTKYLMVQFSVCKSDGTRYFKRLEDVKNSDALKIEALYLVANEVNSESENAGKP